MTSILPEPLSIGEFPGYSRIRISKRTLDIIVRQQLPSWKSALASVGGVYLITDTQTGKLYVGSATGIGGIWARWREYSACGHGGNTALRSLLLSEGAAHADNFHFFAILEAADSKTGPEEILQRESHWKDVWELALMGTMRTRALLSEQSSTGSRGRHPTMKLADCAESAGAGPGALGSRPPYSHPQRPTRAYLNSYRPLVLTTAGRQAITKYGLPPLTDGSCRREPDFESSHPSITALCRFTRFAPYFARWGYCLLHDVPPFVAHQHA